MTRVIRGVTTAADVDLHDMPTRADEPGPGRLISTLAEPIASILRYAGAVLRAGVTDSTAGVYNARFRCADPELGVAAEPSDARLEWAVLCTWLTHACVEGSRSSLAEAEEWFAGANPQLVRTYQREAIEQAQQLIDRIDVTLLPDLLPYVIDPHGAASRRAVIRDSANRPSRAHKRSQGIFYTPGDVADVMVGEMELRPGDPVLDPSCGTGVFLRATARRAEGSSLDALYGIDVDPAAIDSACFVLAATFMRPGASPQSLWHQARMNMAHADALRLVATRRQLGTAEPSTRVAEARRRVRDAIAIGRGVPPLVDEPRAGWAFDVRALFPEQGGFAVIGNPPYAPVGRDARLADLAALSSLRGSHPLDECVPCVP